MTKRRRATPSSLVLATLVVLATLSAAWVTPAAAADDASLRTTITGVSPSVLGKNSTITLSGEVTNTGDSPWTEVQAYLVIPRQPQTDVEGLRSEIRNNPGYAGPRVVAIGRFDEIGDLPAGATREFSVRVPGDELPIAAVDGVYPVGVQILATDDQGRRSQDSVSRAVTVLPRMTGEHAEAPATVVWPFLMPVARDAQGDLVDVAALVEAIGPGGQLRNLLDAATAQNPGSRGVVIDPALVSAVDDLAEGRDSRVDDAGDQSAAAAFRDDLIALASEPSSRTLDFDRTDVLALSRDGGRGARLLDVSDNATSAAIERFGLSPRRLSWPTPGDADDDLLSTLAAGQDRQVLLDAGNLAAWQSELGPALKVQTPNGAQQLLVDDDITSALPGRATAVTLRQRVLASAALASLDRDGDSSSRAAALAVVDPTWDPGSATVSPVPEVGFIEPTSLDDLRTGEYTGEVEPEGDVQAIAPRLIRAVNRALDESQLLKAASNDGRSVDAARARSLASLLGVRWRDMPAAGVDIAQALAAEFREDIAAVTIMGPGSVTLSSSQGAFPLTISNGSGESVSVGVQLLTSNPALNLPDQSPVEIEAGERLTLTVDLDLAQQNATIVTAQLLTPGGEPFGEPSVFNVRTSSVGVILWITMGAAGVFVLFALTRRFRKHPPEDGAADE